MSGNLNHKCSICGREYNFCFGCTDIKTYTPWRTIVDSIEHYKIFMVLRDFDNKYIDKKSAKEQLKKCDLTELEDFIFEVKITIENILSDGDNVSITNIIDSQKKPYN